MEGKTIAIWILCLALIVSLYMNFALNSSNSSWKDNYNRLQIQTNEPNYPCPSDTKRDCIRDDGWVRGTCSPGQKVYCFDYNANPIDLNNYCADNSKITCASSTNYATWNGKYISECSIGYVSTCANPLKNGYWNGQYLTDCPVGYSAWCQKN